MEPIDVQHDEGRQRFEAGAAHVVYRLEGKRLIIEHTEVPPTLRNRGIAAALIRAALTEADRRSWKVVPQCSYAAAYIERHPEFHSLLTHAKQNHSKT